MRHIISTTLLFVAGGCIVSCQASPPEDGTNNRLRREVEVSATGEADPNINMESAFLGESDETLVAGNDVVKNMTADSLLLEESDSMALHGENDLCNKRNDAGMWNKGADGAPYPNISGWSMGGRLPYHRHGMSCSNQVRRRAPYHGDATGERTVKGHLGGYVYHNQKWGDCEKFCCMMKASECKAFSWKSGKCIFYNEHMTAGSISNNYCTGYRKGDFETGCITYLIPKNWKHSDGSTRSK